MANNMNTKEIEEGSIYWIIPFWKITELNVNNKCARVNLYYDGTVDVSDCNIAPKTTENLAYTDVYSLRDYFRFENEAAYYDYLSDYSSKAGFFVDFNEVTGEPAGNEDNVKFMRFAYQRFIGEKLA